MCLCLCVAELQLMTALTSRVCDILQFVQPTSPCTVCKTLCTTHKTTIKLHSFHHFSSGIWFILVDQGCKSISPNQHNTSLWVCEKVSCSTGCRTCSFQGQQLYPCLCLSVYVCVCVCVYIMQRLQAFMFWFSTVPLYCDS